MLMRPALTILVFTSLLISACGGTSSSPRSQTSVPVVAQCDSSAGYSEDSPPPICLLYTSDAADE